jgi:hypothetical protein
MSRIRRKRSRQGKDFTCPKGWGAQIAIDHGAAGVGFSKGRRRAAPEEEKEGKAFARVPG